MTSPYDCFIAGTDTGVGKTVVSLLVLHWLTQAGARPVYLKPFQTGCITPLDPDSDAAFVFAHLPALKDRDPAASMLYWHPEPRAPWFAARCANAAIDPMLAVDRIRRLQDVGDPLVVEGAGGLHVPITADRLLIDIITEIRLPVLLVARAGLGTINHTLLSIEALAHRKIPVRGVLLSDNGPTPVPAGMRQENIEAIEHFGQVQVAGVIPRLEQFDVIPDSILQVIGNCFYSDR